MDFDIVIIFMDSTMQRLEYDNYDINEGIKHSLEIAHEKEIGKVIETIMIEFNNQGLSV